jgi:hypothetical protein
MHFGFSYHNHSFPPQIGIEGQFPSFMPPQMDELFYMSDISPWSRSPYSFRAGYYLKPTTGKRKYCDTVDPFTPQKRRALEISEKQEELNQEQLVQVQEQQEENHLLLEDLNGYLDSLDPWLFEDMKK